MRPPNKNLPRGTRQDSDSPPPPSRPALAPLPAPLPTTRNPEQGFGRSSANHMAGNNFSIWTEPDAPIPPNVQVRLTQQALAAIARAAVVVPVLSQQAREGNAIGLYNWLHSQVPGPLFTEQRAPQSGRMTAFDESLVDPAFRTNAAASHSGGPSTEHSDVGAGPARVPTRLDFIVEAAVTVAAHPPTSYSPAAAAAAAAASGYGAPPVIGHGITPTYGGSLFGGPRQPAAAAAPGSGAQLATGRGITPTYGDSLFGGPRQPAAAAAPGSGAQLATGRGNTPTYDGSLFGGPRRPAAAAPGSGLPPAARPGAAPAKTQSGPRAPVAAAARTPIPPMSRSLWDAISVGPGLIPIADAAAAPAAAAQPTAATPHGYTSEDIAAPPPQAAVTRPASEPRRRYNMPPSNTAPTQATERPRRKDSIKKEEGDGAEGAEDPEGDSSSEGDSSPDGDSSSSDGDDDAHMEEDADDVEFNYVEDGIDGDYQPDSESGSDSDI